MTKRRRLTEAVFLSSTLLCLLSPLCNDWAYTEPGTEESFWCILLFSWKVWEAGIGYFGVPWRCWTEVITGLLTFIHYLPMRLRYRMLERQARRVEWAVRNWGEGSIAAQLSRNLWIQSHSQPCLLIDSCMQSAGPPSGRRNGRREPQRNNRLAM